MLRGRWLAGHLLVVSTAALFVALGFWQLGRQHEVDDRREAARAARAAPATELDPALEPGDVDALVNERVEVRGRFDGGHEFLLRNRVRDGRGGYDVLTPLRRDDGIAVVVDRGWIPAVATSGEALDTAVPAGEVTVRGVARAGRALAAGETVETRGGRPALTRVDLERIAAATGYAVAPVWIEMQSQDPEPGAGAPAGPPIPSFTQVNHTSYAIQWFALALIPLIGWPIVLLRVRRR
jgi:cytochrome oxidase assembly protein ShyY1